MPKILGPCLHSVLSDKQRGFATLSGCHIFDAQNIRFVWRQTYTLYFDIYMVQSTHSTTNLNNLFCIVCVQRRRDAPRWSDDPRQRRQTRPPHRRRCPGICSIDCCCPCCAVTVRPSWFPACLICCASRRCPRSHCSSGLPPRPLAPFSFTIT